MTIQPQGANLYEGTVTPAGARAALAQPWILKRVGDVPGLHPADAVATVEAWLARGWAALELAYEPSGTTPNLGRVGRHDVELSMTRHGAGHSPEVAAAWERFASRGKQVLARGEVPTGRAARGPLAVGKFCLRRSERDRSNVPDGQRLVECCPEAARRPADAPRATT